MLLWKDLVEMLLSIDAPLGVDALTLSVAEKTSLEIRPRSQGVCYTSKY